MIYYSKKMTFEVMYGCILDKRHVDMSKGQVDGLWKGTGDMIRLCPCCTVPIGSLTGDPRQMKGEEMT